MRSVRATALSAALICVAALTAPTRADDRAAVTALNAPMKSVQDESKSWRMVFEACAAMTAPPVKAEELDALAVWPGMQARGWGRVINVLSTQAKTPGAAGAPTAVSRAAGMALTKILSHEGAPHGILVNGLMVGIIESDQWVRRHASDPRGLSWEAWTKDAAAAA